MHVMIVQYFNNTCSYYLYQKKVFEINFFQIQFLINFVKDYDYPTQFEQNYLQ